MANICGRVDQYLVAYLISVSAGTAQDIFPAKCSVSKGLPITVCWAHSASPPQDDPYSGNRMVEAFIEVRTSAVIEETDDADAPRQASEDRVSVTWEAFQLGVDSSSDKLGEAITRAGRSAGGKSMTILSCKVVGESQGFNPRAPKLEGQVWVDSLHLEILAAPSDVL